MKRSDFFKLIGLGAAACVTPFAIRESEYGISPFDTERIQKRLDYLRKYPATYDECFYSEAYDISTKEDIGLDGTQDFVWRKVEYNEITFDMVELKSFTNPRV